uniref:Uncharacterized protein n=1 Tax=Acrobeloides nanus TaxID=290746 RepID=A0A914CV89_9BILA
MPSIRRSPYDDTGIYDPLDEFSKGDDEQHIYHELESLHRISMLLDEHDYYEGRRNRTSSSACSSPIYAVPYEGSSTSSTHDESPSFRPNTNNSNAVYAKVHRDPHRSSGIYQCVRRVAEDVSKRCPPLQIESPFYVQNKMQCYEPSLSYGQSVSSPDSDVDFLAELDKQIAELQIQSDAVRQLVEQARERQDLRSRTRQICIEHINELRKMR